MADPGFPRGGGANYKSEGTNLFLAQIFSKKTNKKENNLTQEEGAGIPGAPLDPPTSSVWY